jgi:hypothetical protein
MSIPSFVLRARTTALLAALVIAGLWSLPAAPAQAADEAASIHVECTILGDRASDSAEDGSPVGYTGSANNIEVDPTGQRISASSLAKYPQGAATFGEDCSVDGSWRRSLTLLPGSSGLADGDAVPVAFTVELDATVDEDWGDQPFQTRATHSVRFSMVGQCTGAGEGVVCDRPLTFSAEHRRYVYSYPAGFGDPDGGVDLQGHYHWAVTTNTGHGGDGYETLPHEVCSAFPCPTGRPTPAPEEIRGPSDTYVVEGLLHVGTTYQLAAEGALFTQGYDDPGVFGRAELGAFVIAAEPLVAGVVLGDLPPTDPPTELTVTTDQDDTDTDPGDGLCETAAGACSLRAALEELGAHVGTTPDHHATVHLPAGDYALAAALPVTSSVTISGAGTDLTVIRGNGEDEVLAVDRGPTAVLADLSVTGGGYSGIRNRADLTLRRVVVSGNANPWGDGGGIDNDAGGRLVLVDSEVSDNTAAGYGGGIYNEDSGGLEISRSLIAGNSAGFDGGGVYDDYEGVFTNVTFHGNAAEDGAGLYTYGGALTNVTVTGNTADSTSGALALGRGGTAHANVAVADNLGGTDCSGRLDWVDSGGGNLAGDDSCVDEDGAGFVHATDLTETAALLASFADHGGPTRSVALQASSPAVDSGVAAACPATDQRGVTRPQGAGCDRGAFELEISGPGDEAPPVSEASVSPAANAAGWHASAPTVTLTAVDEAGGSGVASITYRTTGAQAQAATTQPGATASVPVTVDGVTTVHWFATDVAGNAEGEQSLVIRLDTLAPVLSLPAAITVDAEDSSGAGVSYTATASDALDPAPVVACSPASGSRFPIGTTTVQCGATDQAGNASAGSFDVTVRPLSQAGPLERLRDAIDAEGLTGGTRQSLISKVDAAEQSLAKGKTTPACNQLQALLNHLKAQRGKKLTVDQADRLIAATQRAREEIGC